MNDATNVVAFEPRRPAVPELRFVELRLDEDCSIEMTLYDDAGSIAAILSFGLAAKPEGFDFDRLRAAWARWRQQSSVAS